MVKITVFYLFCGLVCMLSYCSHVQLFGTLGTGAHQAPLSVGFSRQEYWSECHAPSSRGFSQPRDRTDISYTAFIERQILYY